MAGSMDIGLVPVNRKVQIRSFSYIFCQRNCGWLGPPTVLRARCTGSLFAPGGHSRKRRGSD